jgi:hypothetical protein
MSSENPSGGISLAKNPAPLTERAAFALSGWSVLLGGMLKVNDADGNPIEIAAAVVWSVEDTARALFAVDNYVEFVRVQAEASSSRRERICLRHAWERHSIAARKR